MSQTKFQKTPTNKKRHITFCVQISPNLYEPTNVVWWHFVAVGSKIFFPHQPNGAARFKIIAQALLAWGWDELLGKNCWDFVACQKKTPKPPAKNHDGKMGSFFFKVRRFWTLFS